MNTLANQILNELHVLSYEELKHIVESVDVIEDSIDATVKKVYEDVKKFHKVLLKSFVTPQKAIEMADEKSLLIILKYLGKVLIPISSTTFI